MGTIANMHPNDATYRLVPVIYKSFSPLSFSPRMQANSDQAPLFSREQTNMSRSIDLSTLLARTSAGGARVALASVLLAAAPAVADDDQDFAPAPPSIGADVPVTYFGPPPSSVKRELVGPYQELKAGKVDLDKGTITLPLYEGALKGGEPVWYIVTDTDDKGNADALGLNYSSKLTFAEVGRAVRKATLDGKFKLVF
jgi:hypothetical protein